MKSPPALSKTFPWICLVLCLAAFSASFGLARKEALSLSNTIGDLAFRHLEYLQEQKDEMSIIDWAKRLEKTGGVRGFQVSQGPRLIASGGNKKFLPAEAPDGATFSFPSSTFFVAESGKSSEGILRFLLVQEARPNPLSWGFCSLLPLLLGTALARVLSRAKVLPPNPLPLPLTDSGKTLSGIVQADPKPGEEASLLLDSNYVIRQATLSAANLLQKDRSLLLQGHLLDLSPEPLLTQSMKKGEACELSGVFKSHPHLMVSLKPLPEGTLLVLKPPP